MLSVWYIFTLFMYLICNSKVVPADAKGAQGSRRMIDKLHSSLTPGLHTREWVVSSCSHFKMSKSSFYSVHGSFDEHQYQNLSTSQPQYLRTSVILDIGWNKRKKRKCCTTSCLWQLRDKTESTDFINNGHVKFASVIMVNDVIV
jgi:hypothetical protein